MSLQKLKVVNPQVNIHPLAEVKSKHIGFNTNIWQFSVVLEDAVIGRNCNISSHTFIESDVIIGDNVTIKSGVYVWNGIRLEDDVFVGPAVVFTNDLRPRSKQYTKDGITIVKKGATLGANTSVLTGVTIGPRLKRMIWLARFFRTRRTNPSAPCSENFAWPSSK